VEADAPRVSSKRHGVIAAALPSFEARQAWLAINCSKTAVAELMRVARRSVGTILDRVGVSIRPGRLLVRVGGEGVTAHRGAWSLARCSDRLLWNTA
jgi:hypothetical protein